jgi:hypothetical protein
MSKISSFPNFYKNIFKLAVTHQVISHCEIFDIERRILNFRARLEKHFSALLRCDTLKASDKKH